MIFAAPLCRRDKLIAPELNAQLQHHSNARGDCAEIERLQATQNALNAAIAAL